MTKTISRKKVWIARSASLVVVVGATFFFNALLASVLPSASRVWELPVQVVGALGLALLTVGLGTLAVTGCRLALAANAADSYEIRERIEQHLPAVAQVLAGALLTLVYFFTRS